MMQQQLFNYVFMQMHIHADKCILFGGSTVENKSLMALNL